MKRFKIKNNTNGLEFVVEAAGLSEMQPEWGLPERDELDETDKPTGNRLPAEYTIEVEDIGEELRIQAVRAEAQKFLLDTDWLVIREMDSGVPVPSEIKAARQAAREKL